MGRTTDKNRINKFLVERCITVEQLIDLLKTKDPKAYVGRAGHFGEFNEMNEHDFHERKAYVTASGSWRDDNQQEVKILHVSSPDIGPDPD